MGSAAWFLKGFLKILRGLSIGAFIDRLAGGEWGVGGGGGSFNLLIRRKSNKELSGSVFVYVYVYIHI